LTRQSIHLREKLPAKTMDARVKPAHDDSPQRVGRNKRSALRHSCLVEFAVRLESVRPIIRNIPGARSR
jgi:hypothetical protein